MKIIIYWNNEESKKLFDLTSSSLDNLGLSEFVELSQESSDEFKKELNITKEFAFCVEEETIDFKDTIFEWQIPTQEELNNLMISLIWWDSSCSPSACSSCWGGCGI